MGSILLRDGAADLSNDPSRTDPTILEHLCSGNYHHNLFFSRKKS
jgi:hypothetical protein